MLKSSAVFIALGSVLFTGAAIQQSVAEPTVSFHRDVFPIMQRRCAGCHQPAVRSGKLSVVTYAALKSGGTTGAGFVAGRPADSPIYKQVTGKAPAMPKGGPPLSQKEAETLRLWIAQGGRDDTPQPKDPISQEHPPVYAAAPVVQSIAYSPSGDLLAVSGYREILVHHSDGSGLVARLVGKSQRVESVAFSPDGKLLAAVGGTSCRFGELQLWDVEAKKLLNSVEIGFDVLYGVSFSPDGKLVGFGGAEKSAYVYSVPDCKQLVKFDNHSDWIFGTTFTKDSKILVTASRDRAIKLVDIATHNFIDDANYQVYNGGYFAIARNPQIDYVAVGGEEGIVRYYSIRQLYRRTMNREDYNLWRTFDKVDGPIYALAFSPNGTMLAVGGRTSSVVIYNNDFKKDPVVDTPTASQTAPGGPPIPSKTPPAKLAELTGFSGSVHSMGWHPGGKQLAVSGFDGTVHLYEVPSGKLVKTFVPVPLGAATASANQAPLMVGKR